MGKLTIRVGGKENDGVTIEISGVTSVVFAQEDLKRDLQKTAARKVPEKAKPIPKQELHTIIGHVIFQLAETYDGLIEIAPSERALYAQEMDPHMAAERISSDFTPFDVAAVIFNMRSMSDLRQNKRMSAMIGRDILENINELYPEDRRVDIDAYFASRG